jgi:phosphoribosylglycinamide formyltransferase-1
VRQNRAPGAPEDGTVPAWFDPGGTSGARFVNVGVLASGYGSNLEAILQRCHQKDGVRVVAVGSDKPDARALHRAKIHEVPTRAFPRSDYDDRTARDAAMAAWLAGEGVELVVLAGYMQLVTPAFLDHFRERVINVHPALLPAFPGLGAVEQALAYGVKVFGVTVHFVDDGVDSGAIIAQAAVDLPRARTVDEVFAAVRPLEHDLLTHAVLDIAAGRVRRDADHPRRVVVG